MDEATKLTIDDLNRSSKQLPLRDADKTELALHVLTLTPFYPSSTNEVNGCFIKEPIDHLSSLGIASTVFAVSPVYRPRNEPSQSAPAHWIRYPQVPGNLGLSSAGWFLYACLQPRVTQLHRESPISLIHAHGALPCGHSAALLSRRLKIPYVVTVHGLDVFNACQEDGVAAQWRRQRCVDVYQNAQTVICISKKVQQILRAGMQDVRSGVVYNGTDVNLFSPGPAAPNPAAQNLLAVGNLIPTKGQDLILRAVANLASTFPQLRCQFIGEGPDRTRLESLSRELGIAQRVQFLGRRSRAEVAEAMRACSVFVLPSSSEGLGCVYLEAMACGRPVIACHGQGIEEIIEQGRNGWVIAINGLDELVGTLNTLLQSPEECAKTGRAARQNVASRLTLSHQTQGLAAVYREAIAQK